MKYSTPISHALSVVMILFALPSFAKTDVGGKIEQLKENSEASKANLQQYEDNLAVVNANLADTERALKNIEKEKVSLAKQTNSTEQGKKGVDAAKLQIDGYMKAEQLKLTAETQQIDELKKTLALLESNAKKRETNIALYQEKMKKVDTELGSWSEHNQSITELDQALQQKEAEAKADLAKLKEKKANYEEEIAKWRKQVRVSERTYQNFANLKD